MATPSFKNLPHRIGETIDNGWLCSKIIGAIHKTDNLHRDGIVRLPTLLSNFRGVKSPRHAPSVSSRDGMGWYLDELNNLIEITNLLFEGSTHRKGHELGRLVSDIHRWGVEARWRVNNYSERFRCSGRRNGREGNDKTERYDNMREYYP